MEKKNQGEEDGKTELGPLSKRVPQLLCSWIATKGESVKEKAKGEVVCGLALSKDPTSNLVATASDSFAAVWRLSKKFWRQPVSNQDDLEQAVEVIFRTPTESNSFTYANPVDISYCGALLAHASPHQGSICIVPFFEEDDQVRQALTVSAELNSSMHVHFCKFLTDKKSLLASCGGQVFKVEISSGTVLAKSGNLGDNVPTFCLVPACSSYSSYSSSSHVALPEQHVVFASSYNNDSVIPLNVSDLSLAKIQEGDEEAEHEKLFRKELELANDTSAQWSMTYMMDHNLLIRGTGKGKLQRFSCVIKEEKNKKENHFLVEEDESTSLSSSSSSSSVSPVFHGMNSGEILGVCQIDSMNVCCCSGSGKIDIVNVLTGKLLLRWKAPEGSSDCYRLAVAHDKSRLYVTCRKGNVFVFDLAPFHQLYWHESIKVFRIGQFSKGKIKKAVGEEYRVLQGVVMFLPKF